MSSYSASTTRKYFPDAFLSITRVEESQGDYIARMIRPIVPACILRDNACSQILRIRQPLERSVRVTSRSRVRLRLILAAQNFLRVAGTRLRVGCPCQKSPSTNTASFSAGKTKSGFPNKGKPRRHPVMRCFRRRAMSLSSVARLPRERMAAITADLFSFEKMSAIRVRAHCSPLGENLKPAPPSQGPPTRGRDRWGGERLQKTCIAVTGFRKCSPLPAHPQPADSHLPLDPRAKTQNAVAKRGFRARLGPDDPLEFEA